MLALIGLTMATGLFAQNDNNDLPVYELKDIIVRGELWESELQKTTASVSVLDSERIQSSGNQHFGDVINSIPNLTWSGGSSRPRYLQVRGIGENSQFEGETPDSSVRFLVDDLDFTGIGTIGNLFDTQQVEVLRGPQAGAFGVNAAGGVVKLVTTDPTDYWTGKVEASTGEDSLVAGGFAVGGPILEDAPRRVTFRFSAYQLQQDGFRDNSAPTVNREDTNERDEFNTHLKLRWNPSEDFRLEGALFYANVDNGYDEWTLDNTRFDTRSDEPGRDEQQSLATSARAHWTGWANTELTAITTLTDTETYYSYDSDWTTTTDPRTYNGYMEIDRERRVITQEFQLDSKDLEDALGIIDRWTLGAYFNITNEDSAIDYRDMWSSPAFPVTADSEYQSENYALFGQAAHDFTSQTRLIAGFRVERYFNETTTENALYYGGPLPVGTEKSSSTLFGGKITLEHDLNTEHTTFASVARGYKGGGANLISFSGAGPRTYDDEILFNYELGLRSRWLDGKFTSQATVFYLDRSDAQLRDSAGSGGFFEYFTSNLGDAEHFGLETEATWYAHKNLRLTASLGLLETELEATGDDLANSPSYNYSLRADLELGNGFFANIEAVGSDEYYDSNNPANRDQRIRNAFSVINAAVGYRYEQWTVTLWSRNLFDEEYEKRVFYFANENIDTTGDGDTFDREQRYENPADPQQFGVTLNYSW
jgi:outer membrane receptor protein involved in Fe transport